MKHHQKALFKVAPGMCPGLKKFRVLGFWASRERSSDSGGEENQNGDDAIAAEHGDH